MTTTNTKPDTMTAREVATCRQWYNDATVHGAYTQVVRLADSHEILRARCERLEAALRHIAWEPIGAPEDSAATVLDGAVSIARDALGGGGK
jgi:hypothetical protein